jgi:hypothetical protein
MKQPVAVNLRGINFCYKTPPSARFWSLKKPCIKKVPKKYQGLFFFADLADLLLTFPKQFPPVSRQNRVLT